MPDNKITLDRGEWVHALTPDDLPETFRFAAVDITDRAKFLEYFSHDLTNVGGTKRVTFGHGMLRDLYELAVVVIAYQRALIHSVDVSSLELPPVGAPFPKPEVPVV